MKKNVDKQVKIWYTLGRGAPIGALFLLIVCLIFDIESWINYLLIGIATLFAVIAFTWWWWVLDTVKELFNMLKSAHEKFDEVLSDLGKLKKDLNDNSWKRDESKKD